MNEGNIEKALQIESLKKAVECGYADESIEGLYEYLAMLAAFEIARAFRYLNDGYYE